MTTITLPPIPDAEFTLKWCEWFDAMGRPKEWRYVVDKPQVGTTPCYTADQLRARDRVVAQAVIEACALYVENYTEAGWGGLSHYDVADAIRALKIGETR